MPSQYGHPQKGDLRTLAVRAASTANIADLTAASVSVDGVTLVDGDLVLVRAQTASEANGVYKVGTVTSGSAAFTRHAKFDASNEAAAGVRIFVSEGTTYGDEEFSLTTNAPITLGTTSLTFTQRPTKSALDSLETRLSGAESTGQLSSASVFTSMTTRVSTEESVRASADTSLTTLASTNLSTSTSAELSLTTRVSTEESTRASADLSLTTLASTNLSTSTSADVSLTTARSVEASTRASADLSLTTLASTNLSTSTSAELSLTTRVSTETSTRTSAVTSIDTRISSLIASIDA